MALSVGKLQDKYILKKIVDRNFTFTDLNPRQFPQLIHGEGMYCLWHECSHTGTKNARIYFNEEQEIFYVHCYAEGKNYTAYDYVAEIMCKQKQLYKSVLDFLLDKMDQTEFLTQYKLFEQKKQVLVESQFKKKCEYIDNVYNNTGDISSYIEALYCG